MGSFAVFAKLRGAAEVLRYEPHAENLTLLNTPRLRQRFPTCSNLPASSSLSPLGSRPYRL